MKLVLLSIDADKGLSAQESGAIFIHKGASPGEVVAALESMLNDKSEITEEIMKRPFGVWLLVASLIFLAFGGLFGGIAMLADPSGGLLQMGDVLPLLHIPNFILPGLFLLLVMGFAPILLAYGLLTRPLWLWLDRLFRCSGHHWSWTGSMIVGVVLVIWLAVQGIMIGFKWPVQYVTAVNGVLIILFVLIPSVRRFYRTSQ